MIVKIIRGIFSFIESVFIFLLSILVIVVSVSGLLFVLIPLSAVAMIIAGVYFVYELLRDFIG